MQIFVRRDVGKILFNSYFAAKVLKYMIRQNLIFRHLKNELKINGILHRCEGRINRKIRVLN